MKKLVSILLVLALALCAAFAESTENTETVQPETTETTEVRIFSGSFRGGVTFGMTQEEVSAVEAEPLHEQTFGEGQNPHVTVLATDAVDISGYSAKLQYLFWDGSFYALLYTSQDENFYSTMLSAYTETLGAPTAYSSDGTANWVENVSGNRPEMVGDQYVWSWDNNISLTFAQFSGGYIIIFLDSN